MRTIQRIIRRADLPIEYSKGFNPHMNISIAQPLSVGMYSTGEYMDVGLTKEINDFYIKDKLNEFAPPGVKFLEVVKVKVEEGKKIPQAMAMVEAAKYSMVIKYSNAVALKDDFERLLKQEEWVTVKKSKSGEKTVNIKPMIKELNYSIEEGNLKLEAVVSCGSKENLSAELLANYIKDFTSNADKEAFVEIKREEMYVIDGNKFVPLYKYIK